MIGCINAILPGHPPRLAVVLGVLLAFGTGLLAASPKGSQRPANAAAGSLLVGSPHARMMPGMIIVKFRESLPPTPGLARTGIRSLDKLLAAQQVTAIEPTFHVPARLQLSSGRQLLRVHSVTFSGGLNPRQMAARIARHPSVEYAVPKYVHRISAPTPAAAIPNDSLYALMSHLSHLSVPAAWDVVKGEQGDVVMAVVDGGTNWRHEDLQANMWINPGEIPTDGLDNDGNGYPDDIHGWNFANNSGDPDGIVGAPLNAEHGTAVAGVAAAVTDNVVGIAGASWNARLMAVNASCELDSFICFGYEGVVYAAANGADLINISWGSTHTDLTPSEERLLLKFWQDVSDFATENGALIVAAAGNGPLNNDLGLHLPASGPDVLSVGAIGKSSDAIAGFSNYGITVDVFAPGIGINSTLPGNDYSSTTSGTSFSTPQVMGIGALVKTRFPGLTPKQLAQQLRVTADPIDAANSALLAGLLGRGKVNALRAVTDSTTPALRIVEVTFFDQGQDGIIGNGEWVNLTVSLTNYRGDAAGVGLTLALDDPEIVITSSSAFIPALAFGDTASADFQFSVGELADEHPLPFILEIDAGTYRDREIFKLHANEPLVFTHDTGPLRVSLTAEGNIGWTGFADLSLGEGFVYNGTNLLFEGGLLVATSASRVSDCIRGVNEELERDFGLIPGETLTIGEGLIAHEEGLVVIGDQVASFPIGLKVEQQSYADTSDEYNDFIILRYVITNTSFSELTNLYAGLFFDWDINADAMDFARFDADRRMGNVQNDDSAPTFLAATRLLSKNADLSYRSIHNPNEIYGGPGLDGFTALEKWAYLTNGIQTQTLNNVDASTLTTVGPLALQRGESVEVGFAIIGATTRQALETHADNAQQLWDSAIQPPLANHTPVLTRVLPDTTIGASELLTYTYHAEDADGDALVFSLFNAPASASIDRETGVLTYQPAASDSGAQTFAVAVSDGQLVSARRSIVIVEKLAFVLGQSYANPFSLSASEGVTIDYELAQPSQVKLVVYDLLGRRVRTLVSASQPPGKYHVLWNARDDRGRRVSTGVYLYRLEAGNFSVARKIVVLK